MSHRCSGFNRSHKFAVSIGFHDVATGTSLNNVSDQLIRKMHRQNDDFSLREKLANLARRFDSIQFGHSDVHDNYVRLELLGQLRDALGV
jgi:hypothetical protein